MRTAVEPMIGLRYVESIFKSDNGVSPAEQDYSQMISNERAMRFLFGLALDPDDDSVIANETTTWSATYTAFGVDIIDPDYQEKPEEPGEPEEPERTLLVDPVTGISVAYGDGSSFEDEIELADLYDIRLQKNGIDIQPEKPVEIRVPLTDKMQKLTDLRLIYVDAEGNITIISSEMKDGKIIFTTDHFSDYGVIGKTGQKDLGKDPSKTPGKDPGKTPGTTSSVKPTATGDTSPIFVWGVFALISAGALSTLLVWYKKRTKL